MRRSLFTGILVLALLAMASPASAATCPSDRSVAAIDQYCAVLPSADGHDSTPWRGHGERLEMGVSPRIVERIRDASPLGKSLLALPLGAPKSRIPGEGRPDVKAVASLDRLLLGRPFDVSEGATDVKNAVEVDRRLHAEALPPSADEQLALARRLGYEEYPRQTFLEEYRRITRRARRAMERIFYEHEDRP